MAYTRSYTTWQNSPSTTTPVTAAVMQKIEDALVANDTDNAARDSTIAGKEPAVPTGTTSQYYRGDKTWQTLNAASVGLASFSSDTGWITNATGSGILVLATGFTIDNGICHIRKIGSQVFLTINFVWGGGTLTPGTDGDQANTTCATLVSAYRWTGGATYQAGFGSGAGRGAFWIVQSDGRIQLAAMVGTDDIVNGDIVSISGSYLVD